jgi:hypothetical protein
VAAEAAAAAGPGSPLRAARRHRVRIRANIAAFELSRCEVDVNLRLIPVIGLLAALSGCVTSAARQDDLMVTVRSYENLIRWGRLPAAYDYLRPDVAGASEIPAGLDQIKVTGYDRLTGLLPTDEDKHRFRVMASIRYVHLDRQVERSITDQQIWEWDEEAERWWRTNPIPAFP